MLENLVCIIVICLSCFMAFFLRSLDFVPSPITKPYRLWLSSTYGLVELANHKLRNVIKIVKKIYYIMEWWCWNAKSKNWRTELNAGPRGKKKTLSNLFVFYVNKKRWFEGEPARVITKPNLEGNWEWQKKEEAKYGLRKIRLKYHLTGVDMKTRIQATMVQSWTKAAVYKHVAIARMHMLWLPLAKVISVCD